MQKTLGKRGWAVSVLALVGLAACSGADPGVEGEAGTVNIRRLSESQYRNTIADVFGPAIPINGRFEPDMRDHGLLAIGSAKLSITPSGFEQYFSMGSGIAEAVLKQDDLIRNPKPPEPERPRRRPAGAEGEAPAAAPAAAGGAPAGAAPAPTGAAPAGPSPREMAGGDAKEEPKGPPPKLVVACVPADAKKADEACTKATLAAVGKQLFRRPLTEAELGPRVAVANAVADKSGDFYAGMKQGLASLLIAPEFLFRVEVAEAVPNAKGKVRLDGYSKAARLSYLLWDTAPDAELLAAAEKGDLHTQSGVNKQIKRLLASERMDAGARAFFDDMLQNDLFATITKDASIYPKFSLAVAQSSREQTLRTLVDHLVTKKKDYRQIFTTRETFIDRNLASIYKTPYLGDGDWVPYTFPEDDDHAGVVTHVSFLSLFSHPGRSSPTKRGVAVNEVYLCETTELAPANVDFSIVNDVANPNLPTVRQRLLAHSLDESCSGCHNKSDPVGLSLERFDSLGQVRMNENGELIDVSAEIDGHKFEGAKGLGEVLAKDERAPACLVRNVYAYGVGRAPTNAEEAYLAKQAKQFAGDKYVYPRLLERIASSSEFFSFTPNTQQNQVAETAATKSNGGT